MSTTHRYLNIKGGLMDLSSPVVMGILNVTPDSFYSASRSQTAGEIETRLHQIVGEGAGIIDIGAYSSRPGAEDISADEEMRRLASALEIVKRLYPEAVVSIDTFRAEVARRCVEEYGADIINDISGGELDDKMFDMAARLNVPYILMHMKGRPQDMQQHTSYDNFIQEVFTYFARKVQTLHGMGVKDIILDPGFGFSKTLEQNYELMARMAELKEMLDLPLLVGISRKSMIYKLLGTTAEEALNGTTVLNTLALTQGADILRVHDVRAAVETVKIARKYIDYRK